MEFVYEREHKQKKKQKIALLSRKFIPSNEINILVSGADVYCNYSGGHRTLKTSTPEHIMKKVGF